jgi:hypothetical protein
MTKREEYDALAKEMAVDWEKATLFKGRQWKEADGEHWKEDGPEDAWRAAVAKANADQKKLDAIFAP